MLNFYNGRIVVPSGGLAGYIWLTLQVHKTEVEQRVQSPSSICSDETMSCVERWHPFHSTLAITTDRTARFSETGSIADFRL